MRWLSRKFLLSLAGLGAACFLSWHGKLDATTATLIGTIVSAYLAVNVTQKAVTGNGNDPGL